MRDIDRKSLLLGGGVLLAVCVIAVSVYVAYTSSSGWRARQHSDIREFSEDEKVGVFTDLSGNPIPLIPESEQVVVINAWASWSPFTPQEFNTLAELKGVFGDQVRFVALNRMEDPTTARAYLGTLSTYEGIEYVIDTEDTFYKTVEGYAMPETLVYDQIGNIVYHTRGLLSREEVEPILRSLIESD